MTSNRLIAASPSLWPAAAAISIASLACAALISAPRRAWHWARGLFTAPLHKAPRGNADQADDDTGTWHRERRERMPSPAFRTSFADEAGHETHAWPPSLTSPWPDGGPPWSPQEEPETTVLTMVPLYGADDAPRPAGDEEPYETDDEFIESVAHLLPPAALALPLPAWVVSDPACLNGHTSTDEEVESMLQRALTPDVLAALDKEAGRG